MIYTVTLNPAIDYVVRMEALRPGEIHRSTSEDIYFGGKGINVSQVLKELGISSKALGFVAGFTGLAIEEEVRKAGIETDFVRLKEGCSRINVKIKAEQETDINGQGPCIPEEAIEELFEKLDCLEEGDIIVLAGSIPDSLPSDIYEKILDYIKDKKVNAVVDATGELLLRVMKYKPFLVKPNHYELGELFGVTVETEEEAIAYAKKLQEMGARNVLVSMAEEGAVLVAENSEIYTCGVCKGKVRNSVGAGDSMVAGFLAGLCRPGNEWFVSGADWQESDIQIQDLQELNLQVSDLKTYDYERALKLGTAAAGATVFSDGLAKKELIETLFQTL